MKDGKLVSVDQLLFTDSKTKGEILNCYRLIDYQDKENKDYNFTNIVDNEVILNLINQYSIYDENENKKDLSEGDINAIRVYKKLKEYNFETVIPISAYEEKYREIILNEIEKNLKPGPAYYDIEEYTDQTLRQLAEETIREKALILLRDEVPHGIFVKVEKMKLGKTQNKEEIYNIEAVIYCLRESHKGIIIGKNGEMLKRIGQTARIDMEKNFGLKVNLKTWVKVKQDWLDNDKIINKFKLN